MQLACESPLNYDKGEMDSPTLYDDKGCQVAPPVNTSVVKKSLTLNLSGEDTRQTGLSCLGIDSPDFERLIASPADVLSAGTPTTQIIFPKQVTEEQEAYARGFVDALEELHRCQGHHGILQILHSKDATGSFLLPLATEDKLTPSVLPCVLTDNIVPGDMIRDGMIPAGPGISTFTQSSCVGKIISECPSISAVNSSPLTTTAEVQHLKQEYITTTTCNNTVLILPSKVSMADITHCGNITSHVNSLKHVTDSYYVGFPLHSSCISTVTVGPVSVPANLSTTVSRSACETVASINSSVANWLEETAKHEWQFVEEDIDSETCNVRLEHKRARNRLAAQRCRMRKLERISELSERVHELRGKNDRLLLTSTRLQEQIGSLKCQILQHVSIGCTVTTDRCLQLINKSNS